MTIQEKEVIQQLISWFSKNNIQSWPNTGINRFSTKGTSKKPDIVIYSNKLKQHIAIEVKTGDRGRDIYDAIKIVNKYHNDYLHKKIIYLINKKSINIKSFAVATQYSPEGKLFYNDNTFHKQTDPWNEKNKKIWKTEPLKEYEKSRQYLRQLWAVWRLTRQKKLEPGLGLILSNKLNDGDNSPLLFDQQWEWRNIRNQYEWKTKQKDL